MLEEGEGRPSILVIAGEVSGDLHTAKFMREFRELCPGASFWGIGGDAMAAEGAELLYHVKDMAVLGITEVLKRYGWFRRVFHHMLEEADRRKPDAIFLVDYPGFNLRFAKQAKARGHRILYYICPQVWAWKASRIPKMAACIDHLYTIFPFEPALFEGTGLPATYVGHPLVEELAKVKAESLIDLPWAEKEERGEEKREKRDGKLKLAILPGSRDQEIRRNLPVMLLAAKKVEGILPLVAAANEEQLGQIEAIQAECGTKVPVVIGKARQVLWQADGAMVASGTATLEAGLLGCPMVIVYRVSGLTYFIGKRVVKLPGIGLVNIVLGSQVFPELIQDEATPASVAEEVTNSLINVEKRELLLEQLQALEAQFSHDQQPENLADEVVSALQKND